MKKKLTAVSLGLALALTLGTGSAFADSKLNTAIKPAIGVSYKTGGTTTNGFDCSGFTTYVYKKLGLSLPRTSTAQYKVGTAVSKSNLKAGDLVFFNTSGKGVSHVGIYVGGGKFAHSSSSRGVIVSPLSQSYYAQRYVGAKRVMSQSTYKSVAVNYN
ncbi:NLP/P60 protein [Paenibacillus vortex V453]|uniref:Hydrolase n=2 Tax=Paenibacillus TaxID=44249 RepID=A0A163J123_9BACL|nr:MULTISPECIES: C40 family peptidase [Paenibacillus]ANA80276.1 hydrolase [Paenibacillus glucanolyticus]AVV55655.1 NlpC/P60 family protein [Paenibacillus glucanolyticus]AWP30237.1 hydrolase [Paenibacillus sp. Cedars]EFU43474.1 NLP/P60 protein [Paenibacillus vortex V453]ETT33670.1 NLP/P60 protein [Paenibacillus sp. FSL R5-808]